MLCNLGHTGKLCTVTSSQIQERQLIKLLELLVTHLNNLVVAVSQRFGTEAGPELRLVKFLGHLNGNIKVTTLNGKVETSGRVLDELEGDFGVPLFLEIRDN